MRLKQGLMNCDPFDGFYNESLNGNNSNRRVVFFNDFFVLITRGKYWDNV